MFHLSRVIFRTPALKEGPLYLLKHGMEKNQNQIVILNNYQD